MVILSQKRQRYLKVIGRHVMCFTSLRNAFCTLEWKELDILAWKRTSEGI